MNDYNMQSMEFDTNIMKDIEKQRIIEQLEEGVLVINFTKKDGTTRWWMWYIWVSPTMN